MHTSFVDIHCHLLPRVDDGAKSWDESLAMARLAANDGTTTVIATPHQLGNFGHNRGDDIRRLVIDLQQRLNDAQVPLQVLPGADVRIEPGMIKRLLSGEVLTLGDHCRHVLLELPHELYLPLEPVIDELARRKMVGILSHPERNEGILRRPAVLEPLVEQGCLMQITAGSVCGTFGPECQKLCERMLAEGLVHFVATDAHGSRSRRPLMRRAFERVAELTDEATAIDLCSRNPAAVAAGQSVQPGRRGVASGGPNAGGLPQKLLRNCHMVRYRHSRWLLVFAIVLYCARIAAAVTTSDIKWSDARQVGPFTIQATFALAQYEKLFAELPELQRELTRTLGIPAATEPIYVYIFSDAEQYRAYTQQHFPQVPYRPALFVVENGLPGVYTYQKPDLDIDLRHECTHALLHAALPVVPLWLDEGIAKYFEVPAGRRAFDHPYFDDMKWKWSLRLGMVRSIESLEERDDLSQMDAADYRYSWAWAHFMMHGPQPAHQTLVQYLASYRQWTPPGKLSVRLAEAVPNPTEQMIQHFKHWEQ